MEANRFLRVLYLIINRFPVVIIDMFLSALNDELYMNTSSNNSTHLNKLIQ